MRTPTYLHFPLDEFRARLDGLRGRMATAGLDALVLHGPENIYYLSGYQTPGYYLSLALIVPLERDPILIPPPHEESLVPAYSIYEDYRLYRDTHDWIATTRDTLLDLGLGTKCIGVERGSWFLTVRDHARFTDLLGDATIVDGSGLVEQGRMIKSPREIAYMRAAAEAAQAGMAAGLAATRAGATEADVAAAIHRGQLGAGSEYPGIPPFVTSGPRSMLVHASWSPRPLEPGDAVFLEVPGCVHRYHAAFTRAAWIGEPPPHARRVAEVGAEALAEAKAAMRPGIPAAAVFEAGRHRIDAGDVGYTQGRRLGYALGTAFPPRWDEGHIINLNRNEPRPLEPGMVFHVITTMRPQRLGGAVGMSDTVLVTPTGAETLTARVPPQLYVR